MKFECQCRLPGFCEHHGRIKVGRQWDICNYQVLTPERCGAYWRLWEQAVGRACEENGAGAAAEQKSPESVGWRQTSSPPTNDELSCLHRGPLLRNERCRLCGDRERLESVFACELHGECSLQRFRAGNRSAPNVCATCADRLPHEVTMQINHGAGGLGDALLGLAVVKSLHERGERVAYNVHPDAIPFLSLFDGYDLLGRHTHDQGQAAAPNGHLQLNLGYHQECQSRAAIPRWERYARNVGAGRPMLPELNDPEGLRELGSEFAGSIVLAPFSTWTNREWRIESWVTLETMLTKAGYRVVIVDKTDPQRPHKLAPLAGEKVVDAPADMVAAVLLNAAVVVGNDSGIAHLAGIMGVPTIAICGQTTGKDIFGIYPRVTSLQGSLDCSGCWWQAPYDGARCDPCCAAMQTILPTHVLAEIDRICLPGYGGGASILSHDKLAVIRDAVLATNHLPGDVAELGVYRGGTARLIGHFAPDATLHLFDTFAGMPADDTHAHGSHRRGDFADCSEAAVLTLLDNPKAQTHAGVIPAGAPSNARYRFAHVDLDLQQSTAAAIEYLRPRMVRGGMIVFDDYDWRHCPGVAAAIHSAFGDDVALGRPTFHQATLQF